MQKCGLCSLLSRLLRRAMCVGSRRGSGESYYQELAETNVPTVQTMETTDSSIYIRLIPNDNRRRMSDTDKDRPLLESLAYDDKLENTKRRHACTGRFLTMHKRRRKKLTTRALLQDTAILDDVLHGQVQCILNQVGNWRFNAFTLETVTGGRSLPVLCVHLFHWYGLLDHFNLDVVRLWKLFTLIEEGYHSTNPYHNSIHATDVTQAMHCFLQESSILQHLEPIEIMASLIGAVTHDLDHPGVNQPFLIATSNHLAALYENTSVLENHHWRSAVGCLLESGVAEQIQTIRPQLEKQISSLILATDITRQQEFLTKLRGYLDTNTLDMRKAEHRHFILQIALKSADISNPCRPWDISKKWSHKVCEEFFRQGDYERQLNLPVTSLCDRFSTSVPKIQVGFFKFVVTPLFDEWHRFLNSSLSRKMMRNLKYNQIQWENKVASELAEETRTEISDTEVLDNDDVDDDGVNNNEDKSQQLHQIPTTNVVSVDEDVNDGSCADDDIDDERCIELSDSSEVLLPEIKLPRRSSLQIPGMIGGVMSRFDRRHSVPVNPLPPKIVLPTRENVSREAIREDMETRYENDSFSILSSDDSSDSFPRGGGKSSDNSVPDRERPLSAETLVPDLSIATMSDCADRLTQVMHGAVSVGNTNNMGLLSAATISASNKLIRQQTFPPLQPYIRARYLSAAADMGACTETLIEQQSASTSSSESPVDPAVAIANATTISTTAINDPHQQQQQQRGILVSKKESFKREQEFYQSEKSCKIAKLSIELGQKENLDPSMLRKTLNRRRGSAPVTAVALPAKSLTGSAGGGGGGGTTTGIGSSDEGIMFKTCRRGSMPVDVIKHTTFDTIATTITTTTTSSTTPSISNRTSSVVTTAGGENILYTANVQLIQRRGSVPCDSLTIFGGRNGCNGKSRNRTKILRRRSSGGAEMLSPIIGESLEFGGGGGGDTGVGSSGGHHDSGSGGGGSTSTTPWYRFKREVRNRSDLDSLLSKRRGSLPVEVLAISHSGTLRH